MQVDKPYPRCDEQWRHPESGHIVKVWRLCIGYWGLSKNLGCKLQPKGTLAEMDVTQSYTAQCVIYVGIDNGEHYIRTVENFLERFERI